MEIQPDLPALSRGKTLQDAENVGVKMFQYVNIDRDPYRHESIWKESKSAFRVCG